ncbi:MAG: hypothetical protein AB9903_28900 [Vulcanimicrobiota bacterium]
MKKRIVRAEYRICRACKRATAWRVSYTHFIDENSSPTQPDTEFEAICLQCGRLVTPRQIFRKCS